jgi:hypothetical protein
MKGKEKKKKEKVMNEKGGLQGRKKAGNKN